MSMGRRLTLISAVLNVLPMYFKSIFRFPRRIAEIMEKAMRRCSVEEEPLSKKVIRSKWSEYGLQDNGWDAGLARYGTLEVLVSLFREFIRLFTRL